METAKMNELNVIGKIVRRAATMTAELDRLSLHIDLDACMRECPLDLDALLNADDANFAHDVFGIVRHMDRTTGQLTGCFRPRFAL